MEQRSPRAPVARIDAVKNNTEPMQDPDSILKRNGINIKTGIGAALLRTCDRWIAEKRVSQQHAALCDQFERLRSKLAAALPTDVITQNAPRTEPTFKEIHDSAANFARFLSVQFFDRPSETAKNLLKDHTGLFDIVGDLRSSANDLSAKATVSSSSASSEVIQ